MFLLIKRFVSAFSHLKARHGNKHDKAFLLPYYLKYHEKNLYFVVFSLVMIIF